ncbi:MAG: DUF4398 domain-containing protein [Bdellovibrionales bacterium]|nr:DUF4398 domain-containing protein [Bdellovibrionales bacterium]
MGWKQTERFGRGVPWGLLFAFALAGCSVFHTRPAQQLSHAEAALRSAQAAGAEQTQPGLYQLSKDALLRARAAYRVKNFEVARKMAIRARRIAEDAELKTLEGQSDASNIFVEEQPTEVPRE